MNEMLTTVHEYYKAFSTLELEACVPFFAMPCMFMGLRGTFAVLNRDDLARVLGPTLSALKTKDYLRSEFADSQVIGLTETAALVRGVAVRYRANGMELERVPISYLMHQTGAAWKIAVVASPQ